jgi:hypothetical protein
LVVASRTLSIRYANTVSASILTVACNLHMLVWFSVILADILRQQQAAAVVWKQQEL